jgi:signal transduction histidine kinase/ActR/RegA family two-component response regulator
MAKTVQGQGSQPFASAALGPALPYIFAYGASVIFAVVLSPFTVATVWPGNAILACGLLLLPRRSHGWCVVGCAFAYLTTVMLLGRGPFRPFLFVSLNIGESLLMVYLSRRLLGPNLDFSDGRRLLILLVGVVVPAAVLTAIGVGVVSEVVGRVTQVGLPPNRPELWVISHAMGAALVIPGVMVLANRRRYRVGFAPASELAGALAVLLPLMLALFWWRADFSLLFLIFPLMMLVAFRYGPVGAATASLMLSSVAVLYMFAGLDRSNLPNLEMLHSRVQSLQFFVSVVSMTTLPAAGAVASHARMRGLLARRTLTAREARRRADAAAKAKGEFLANMSHEIRTPLNGVIGLADALSRTELAPNQREMLKMILGSGKALTGLLGDALDLARADSGALTLVDEPFDVRDAIGSAAYLFETIAREKGLTFEVTFDVPPPGAVAGDALRIKQVVSNLISNAVKFTSQGGVVVAVSLSPGAFGKQILCVAVRDTGQGFGEEVKTRLFKRFEQGDSSVTRRFGGSGLGLSIAQRLAQMMNGRIVCDSIPGEGSVFAFTVALETAAGPVVRTGIAAHEPQLAGRRLTVLLAEDHPVNRKVVQAMLGDSVDLTLTVNGSAALEAATAHPFDVILMDTHMPEMDGLTAIRAIRELEARTGRAPSAIVSLTADAMPQQIEASLAAGADLHLAKPITGESLFRAIETAVSLSDPAAVARAV